VTITLHPLAAITSSKKMCIAPIVERNDFNSKYARALPQNRIAFVRASHDPWRRSSTFVVG
jgi:hypothetical protein